MHYLIKNHWIHVIYGASKYQSFHIKVSKDIFLWYLDSFYIKSIKKNANK